ncbi:tetratricopeptide repeat protein [Stigmatella sp. ncwal1]|uniref:Tetratricopeptide repeat protein n=1 Tax=Stigmatella ashevillensis TaxID=2995309 RepID=A0ABT5DPC8_9BACT|nr:tetratricopeptide repeat protein [Stigmatella ashevillena]MDC0715003.1 tetratricopeptide repeat protein [Stigmatella ashevillena]
MVVRCILICFAVMLLGAVTPSVSAQAAFERGEKALAENQLGEAAVAYRQALTDSPNWAPALNGLGSTLFKQGQTIEATALFRSATESDPDFKLAWFNLGYAARKAGDFATAVRAYERYTQLAPEDPDGHYGLGESHRQQGQGAKALAAYEAYLEKEKRPSEQKWVEQAREHVAALKPQPRAAPTAPVEPLALPTSNLTPHPALSLTRVRDGDALLKERRYREAAFAYLDAAHADGGNVEALFKLGNVLAVLGYYGQAIERWNRVAQLTSDATIRQSALENVTRAQVRVAQQGGSPQAQGVAPGFGPVAETARAQARRFYEQGVQRIQGEDYVGAVQSLTQSVVLEPTLSVAYTARGSAYIGLRRYAEAAVDYEYALRLAPDMASPLYGLGEAYRMLGRTEEARASYERYAASTARDVRPELQSEARQTAARLR